MNRSFTRNDDLNTMTTSPSASLEEFFLLQNAEGGIEASGCVRLLKTGDTSTFGDRVRGFFSEKQSSHVFGVSAPLALVGALPFDPRENDFLYQPKNFRVLKADEAPDWSESARQRAQTITTLASQQIPSAQDYAIAVDKMRRKMSPARQPNLEKVVLARSLDLETDETIDPVALVEQLNSDPTVTTFLTPLPLGDLEKPEWLLGATPELLVSRKGLHVVSHPLAGSIPRNPDPDLDRQAAERLLASRKDHDEHRFVVEAIRSALAPLCSIVEIPEKPSLKATATMWHLGTKITAVLKDKQTSVADLVAALHPTPAVCGTPQKDALQAIRDTETFERGFYTGAVGWTNADGDGDWYVAIRCAHIQDQKIRLFAGAGIVAESIPELEMQETSAKFRAMLNALNISDSEVN